eukprot:3438443-Rhodomonas_salina.2
MQVPGPAVGIAQCHGGAYLSEPSHVFRNLPACLNDTTAALFWRGELVSPALLTLAPSAPRIGT